MNQLQKIYSVLLKEYGPQGWWPLLELHDSGAGVQPTKTGSVSGYHPGDYSYPKTKEQVFEICCGAILTQNTGWPQVEKALLNLKKISILNPRGLLESNTDILKNAIKPAGYFNQKAKKLVLFTEFFMKLNRAVPTREELLNLWGIGNETADSMLLYAFKVPVFVVDAYTKRIFSRIGLCKKDARYEEVQALFEKNLKKDLKVYQEYHALIVEHAKRCCGAKAKCEECGLKSGCARINA
jgi:endonuclease-3 related protein